MTNPTLYHNATVNAENVLDYVASLPGETFWMIHHDFGPERLTAPISDALDELIADGLIVTRMERGAIRYYPVVQ